MLTVSIYLTSCFFVVVGFFVVGINEGTLENNYYTACNVGGVANATGVGCSQYDEDSYLSQSDIDGAKPALLDNEDNTSAITLMGNLPESITYSACLNGRTFYKDGYWNTLCLPFDLKDFTGTPLEDATVMQFDAPNEESGFNSGTLTLKFKKADEIWAGSPYIVRWGTPESPAGGVIENPVFPAVRINEFQEINPDFCGNTCHDRSVRFYGTYKPVNIYHDLYYTLYLGAENKLYYPTNDSFNINAFRAYFELGKGYFFGTSTSNVKEIVLNYGD